MILAHIMESYLIQDWSVTCIKALPCLHLTSVSLKVSLLHSNEVLRFHTKAFILVR